MNTWGIYSINASTFNASLSRDVSYPKQIRDKVYTALKLNNFVFNVLGYIPGVSVVSGSIRMAVGFAIVIGTLVRGDPHAMRGEIIGPFYWEALATGVSQIARGALEALVQNGQAQNLILDIVATPWNLGRSSLWDYHCCGCFQCEQGQLNHEMDAPSYPFVFRPLHAI